MDWGLIRLELITQDKWYSHDFLLKYLWYILVTLTFNCNKINDSSTKKTISIWNRMQLCLRLKKFVNGIIYSKFWYIGQTYTISKFIKEEIEKKKYQIFSGTRKNMTSQTPRSTLHSEAWARYFSYSIDIDN